jgi:hypothetical protein
MVTYTSRKLTEADIERILELFFQAYSQTDFGVNARVNLTAQLLHGTSFLCLDNERIVGHVTQRQFQKEIYTSLLIVDPSYKQLGIGKQLIHNVTAEPQGDAGLICGSPVTHHPYSQKICLAEGYFPTRTDLAAEIDLGAGQRETFIWVTKLLERERTVVSAYLPDKYNEIARHVLKPFCELDIQEHLKTLPDGLHEALERELQPALQRKSFPVDLNNPYAPTGIAYLESQGFYCAGFSPRYTKEGTILFSAYMMQMPKQGLVRDKIKIIPAVEPLFDFVWQQYEAQRK